MLQIGDGDRRVPPDQGRAWFHALKSNLARQQKRRQDAAAQGKEEEVTGKEVGEVQMLVFPGNGHALSSTVEAEIVGFESGLSFLAKYTEF
jgi:acylaminoacyl-peptidase